MFTVPARAEPRIVITRWIVDTRNCWQGQRIQEAAPEYLALVSNEERARILEKYNIADARMSLASALLKRAYISKVTGLSIPSIRISTRGDMFGKPYFVPPESPDGQPWPYIDFNVSHQAGLTILVGIAAKNGSETAEAEGSVLVGCDIVAPRERLDIDLAGIEEFGFDEFISAFEAMFSPAELSDIIHHVPTAPLPTNKSSSPKALLEAKLRRFYTYFCVKETYIKLVGEGLLADWIKECEFRNVQVPMPLEGELWGEKVTAGMNREQTLEQDRKELEIWLRGKEIRNVKTEMQAFEDGFVIASMMTPSSLLGPDVEFPPWKMVDLENDVLDAGYGG